MSVIFFQKQFKNITRWFIGQCNCLVGEPKIKRLKNFAKILPENLKSSKEETLSWIWYYCLLYIIIDEFWGRLQKIVLSCSKYDFLSKSFSLLIYGNAWNLQFKWWQIQTGITLWLQVKTQFWWSFGHHGADLVGWLPLWLRN